MIPFMLVDQVAREPYFPFPAKSIKNLFKALYLLSKVPYLMK